MRKTLRSLSRSLTQFGPAICCAVALATASCGVSTKKGTVTPGGDNCAEGTQRCNQLTLQTCTNSTWTKVMDCGATCDASLGCVDCPPNGTVCDGANVRSCDAMGNIGDVRTTCMGACVNGTCTDPCGMAASELSYLGCDYFPTVTTNSQLIQQSHFAVAVANPNNDDVMVTVTRAGKQVAAQTIKSSQVATIQLPWVLELKEPYANPQLKDTLASTKLIGGAYKLTASEPVTVYQFNPIEFKVAGCTDPQSGGPCYTYTNDASLLLPSSTLTAHYIAIARESFMLKETQLGSSTYLKSPGFISIVGAEAAVATVKVKFTADTIAGANNNPAAFKAGATATFQLNQGDVLQLLSDSPATCAQQGMDTNSGVTFGYCDVPNTDLTGTEITADHKLAVFSGHDCTFVPFNRWACDHLEQQMLPLESWGKDYLGSHSQRVPISIPDLWRVVSGADNNMITFDPASVHAPVALNRGEWIEFATTADFEATGTDAFQLVEYMTGEDYNGYGTGKTNPGDPAMSLSVPIEQYRNDYTFLTPDTYTLNYVNVTAPDGTTITIDGTPLAPGQLVAFGAGKYAAARINLKNAGPHEISGTAPFGIAVYGLASYTSYMFPGGLDVKMINVQ